nr:hypothetical protein GCM10020092_084260 [Actinoplanes digitatis]
MGLGAEDPRQPERRRVSVMTDLEGLTAIVTGGASGIGAATVALLRERGARVA